MIKEIHELWDFNDPEGSERRFRQALASAEGESAFVLRTQIARTFGMRLDYKRSRQILAELEPGLAAASLRAQAYYHLELGRSYVSATHSVDSLSEADKESARSAYLQAFQLASQGGFDALAIDALHMMPFVETSTNKQIYWNRKALDYLWHSNQPSAKKWEGSLRNNLGYALHQQGHYEAALEQFQLALSACEKEEDGNKIRVARWMIGWTLRFLQRYDEAIILQQQLEAEWDELGVPDPYVYEELEILFRSQGQLEEASHYAAKLAAIRK